MTFEMHYFGMDNLTLTETKILLWLADTIRENLTPSHRYEADITKLSERMGHQNVKYTELKTSVIRLASSETEIQAGSLVFTRRLFEKIDAPSGTAMLYFTLHPTVEVLFLRIARMFNSDEIDLLLKTRSIFTIKLYSLIRDRIWSGDVIPIDELRAMLGIADRYPRYANFKARILTPATEELRSHFGLTINLVEHKHGGDRVTEVQFNLARYASHVHLDVNRDQFYEEAKYQAEQLGINMTPALYDKWIQKGEYAFIVALDYVRSRIETIRLPVPYLTKLLDTEDYGQPLNGLQTDEYLLLRDFLDRFRETVSLTPLFVIEKEFHRFCAEAGLAERAGSLWVKASDKINKDINAFISMNRKKKHPRHTT
ncbi:replication initiation protein [Paenibacillus rubinfantis]|uniref:replication initiation protein n=1 Tax=Paenibacillus rubinfantis TaxID=1720296 RepID=UPI00073EE63E|nr:replication initiation protein [Paenibacillus rubinfantis]